MLGSLKASALAMSVFVAVYLAATIFVFGGFRQVEALLRLGAPPRLDHVSAKSALQPGDVALLPRLESISATTSYEDIEGARLVTLFDIKCTQARASVSFWNRLHKEFSKRGVPVLAAACGENPADVADFQHSSGLRMPMYYAGECKSLAPGIDPGGGIVQYLLSPEGAVIHAWRGRPLFRYAENDRIAQVLAQHRQARLNPRYGRAEEQRIRFSAQGAIFRAANSRETFGSCAFTDGPLISSRGSVWCVGSHGFAPRS